MSESDLKSFLFPSHVVTAPPATDLWTVLVAAWPLVTKTCARGRERPPAQHVINDKISEPLIHSCGDVGWGGGGG